MGGAEDIILLIFLCHTPIAAIHAAFQAFLHTFRKDFAPFTAFMIKHLRPLCLRRGEGILMNADEDIRACFIGNTLPLCHIRVLTAAQCRIRITGENDLRTALLKIFRQLFCDCEVQYFFILAACACFAGVPAAMPCIQNHPHAHHGKEGFGFLPKRSMHEAAPNDAETADKAHPFPSQIFPLHPTASFAI